MNITINNKSLALARTAAERNCYFRRMHQAEAALLLSAFGDELSEDELRQIDAIMEKALTDDVLDRIYRDAQAAPDLVGRIDATMAAAHEDLSDDEAVSCDSNGRA